MKPSKGEVVIGFKRFKCDIIHAVIGELKKSDKEASFSEVERIYDLLLEMTPGSSWYDIVIEINNIFFSLDNPVVPNDLLERCLKKIKGLTVEEFLVQKDPYNYFKQLNVGFTDGKIKVSWKEPVKGRTY